MSSYLVQCQLVILQVPHQQQYPIRLVLYNFFCNNQEQSYIRNKTYNARLKYRENKGKCMHVYGKTVSCAVRYLDKRAREWNVCTRLPSWHPTDLLTRSAIM